MITLEEFKEVINRWQEREKTRYKCQRNITYFTASDEPRESEVKEFYNVLIKGEHFIEYKEIPTVEELEEFAKDLFFRRASFSIGDYGDLNYVYNCAVYDTGDGQWIFPGSYLKKKPHKFDRTIIDEEIKRSEILDKKLEEKEKRFLEEKPRRKSKRAV